MAMVHVYFLDSPPDLQTYTLSPEPKTNQCPQGEPTAYASGNVADFVNVLSGLAAGSWT